MNISRLVLSTCLPKEKVTQIIFHYFKRERNACTFKYLLNKEKKNYLKIPLPSAKNVVFFFVQNTKKRAFVTNIYLRYRIFLYKYQIILTKAPLMPIASHRNVQDENICVSLLLNVMRTKFVACENENMQKSLVNPNRI